MGAHDLFFRHVFSVPAHASVELAHVLSPALAARILWDTLRLEPGTFVDAALSERETDLLFSARVSGAEGDPLRGVRAPVVARPIDAVPARGVRRAHPRGGAGEEACRGAAPAGDPGRPAPRPCGMDVASIARRALRRRDLLDAVGPHALALRIHVDDLAASTAEAILARKAPPMVRLALGLLRDARSLAVEELLERWAGVMIEVSRRAGREALETAVQYAWWVSKTDDPARMLAAARAYGGRELEEVVMGLGERLVAQGKAEGKPRERPRERPKRSSAWSARSSAGRPPPSSDASDRRARPSSISRWIACSAPSVPSSCSTDARVSGLGRVEADQGKLLREGPVAALGIAMCSTWHVVDDLRDGRLEVVLPDHALPETGIHPVKPQRRLVPPRVHAFVDFLAERLGGTPPWER